MRIGLAAVLLVSMAGCAHRYRVCLEADEFEACREGYTKHDARVAAETLESLPGVDRATVEKVVSRQSTVGSRHLTPDN
jgi:hypothetical protein